MRKRTLLAATAVIVVTAAAAAAFGLLRPEGAVGAEPTAANVVGTLAIEGLTPPDQPIKVLAYSWGLSAPVTCLPGPGGCSSERVNIQDLSLTRYMDTLSPEIVRALATGKHFASATLLVNASGVGNAPTHRYEFEPVIFSSESLGGSGGSRQTENLTFTFAKFKFENVS